MTDIELIEADLRSIHDAQRCLASLKSIDGDRDLSRGFDYVWTELTILAVRLRRKLDKLTNEGGAIVTNPKWEIGPVKLVDGSDAWIFLVQPESKHQRYIGKARNSDGEWRALHWCDSGRVPYTATGHAKNLIPPPKKTVRVRCWLNVYRDGTMDRYSSRIAADNSVTRIACIEIDREVTEGEGL